MLPVPSRGGLALVGLVGVLLSAAPAWAQSIEDARGHWFDADFEAARGGFLAVLESESLTPVQALEAHRYLAVLYTLEGDEAHARAHADAAVALDLEVAPPDGSPREASDLFRTARRRLGNREAELRIEGRPARAGEPARVTASLDPAPPALVSTLRLRCGGDEQIGPPPSVWLELPIQAGDTASCSADALTARGVPLLTIDREVFEEEAERLRTEDQGPAEERKAWPKAVGITAGVLAVAGVVLTVMLVRTSENGASLGSATVVNW